MSENNNRAVSIDVDALDLLDTQGERGTPERNLLMAILERAILDFVGNDPKELKEAEEWMFTGESDSSSDNSTSDYSSRLSPFSFPWICQQLDLDLTFVADTIRAMPKRGKRRVAPWYFMKSDAAALAKAS